MEAVKNEQLIKRTEVENTPFVIVETEMEAFLTLGRYKISPTFERANQVEEYMERNFWEIVFQMINCVHDAYTNSNNGATEPSPE